MAVLARLSASGMTTDTYDEASAQLTPLVQSAPGFVAHVAFVVDGEFHVSEVWDSRDDFQNWFDNNVKPNVPGVQIDVVMDVHNVVVNK
jgi:heme-degrading monooxygenase HmoA